MTDDKLCCEICNKEFTSQENLTAHNRIRHHNVPLSNDKIVSDTFDDYILSDDSDSKILAEESIVVEKPVVKQKSQSNTTKKTNRRLYCDMCDKEFGSQEAIIAHNKSKHYRTHKSRNHTSKTWILIGGAIVVVALIVAVFIIIGNKSTPTDGTTGGETPTISSDGVQIARLYVSGSKYILEPSTFKKDVPVKIIADISRVPGCSKAITIPAFNIFKYVDAKDNTITFTPTQTGTFNIACSMSMYTGTFTVE